MSISNNIWEVAEAYVAGTLTESELGELASRMQSDAVFAKEFNESTELIGSITASGKNKRFKTMVGEIAQEQANKQKNAGKRKLINFSSLPQVWKTAAVAASVAILTSTITIWSLKPAIKRNDSQYTNISREVANTKKMQAGQQAELKQLREIIKENNKPAPPPSDVRYSGTGFALTNDGYFVTSNHVIHNNNKSDFDSVYIQNHDGQYYKAYLVTYDADADIAIMKVEKKNFRFGKGELPYTIATSKAGLGSQIFTLGFPNEDIVYAEGYIHAKNGIEGNDQQYTLQLMAEHGQSGSPVIDQKGAVIGILTAIGSQAEGNNYGSSYAVSSKALIELMHKIPNEPRLNKTNKLSRLSREEQIAKMENYTFSVKVYKK